METDLNRDNTQNIQSSRQTNMIMQAEHETDNRQGHNMQTELVRENRQNVYTGTPSRETTDKIYRQNSRQITDKNKICRQNS